MLNVEHARTTAGGQLKGGEGGHDTEWRQQPFDRCLDGKVVPGRDPRSSSPPQSPGGSRSVHDQGLPGWPACHHD